ncbi:MAG: serine/threonine-protein kinase [Pseudomonadota bacterium]
MITKPDISLLKKELPDVEIIEEIGSGGFKVVYKAMVNGTPEALKLVQIPVDPNDEGVKEENRKRIFREIGILKACKSPYLVKLGSIQPKELSLNDQTYVVYSEELLTGSSLRQLLKSGYKPTFDELRSLITVLFNVVKEIASKNIIHRDIKPDNIIKTDSEDRPFVLLDFGIAFQIGGSNLTRDTHHVPGTLYYIAPEMLDAGFRQSLDYRADLYTVGLTLYEYASGMNPYAKKDEAQFTTLYRIKTAMPDPLLSLCPDLPPNFCTLVDNLMKKLPALRPANINMLIKKLEGIR